VDDALFGQEIKFGEDIFVTEIKSHPDTNHNQVLIFQKLYRSLGYLYMLWMPGKCELLGRRRGERRSG
jgi:hypothetical protein